MQSNEKQDYYPLSLYLGSDEVEKLGLGKCGVGEELMMHAMVRVSSMSSSDGAGGKHESMTLEIRKAGMETAAKEKSEQEKGEALYSSSK